MCCAHYVSRRECVALDLVYKKIVKYRMKILGGSLSTSITSVYIKTKSKNKKKIIMFFFYNYYYIYVHSKYKGFFYCGFSMNVYRIHTTNNHTYLTTTIFFSRYSLCGNRVGGISLLLILLLLFCSLYL